VALKADRGLKTNVGFGGGIVRNVRWALPALGLLCVLILTACHGSKIPTKNMQFVNQTDTRQVMEFKLPKVRDMSILDRVHIAIIGINLKGKYVLKSEDTIVDEGSLEEASPGFVLESKDGKQHQFEIKQEGVIKDEGGTTWNLENPEQHAVLRQW